VAYQLVAVDFLPPHILGQQMQQLSCSLSQGKVAPLPQAGYSMSAVVSAMRLLAQASHTGKVRDSLVAQQKPRQTPSHADTQAGIPYALQNALQDYSMYQPTVYCLYVPQQLCQDTLS
jgi:hypothetical protein